MGKSDVVLYNFLEDRDRFADLYNGGWFGGQKIILPGELRELDGRYVDFPAQAKGNKAESKSRMSVRSAKCGRRTRRAGTCAPAPSFCAV